MRSPPRKRIYGYQWTHRPSCEAHANQYHRWVIQLAAIPHDDEAKILRLDIQPSSARSLAAILTRAADLTEGLA
jgi:hypothetical protein